MTRRNSPRHRAGMMKLDAPITAMCAWNNFLEIFTRNKSYLLQSPEVLDPNETNPDMKWAVSASSNGSSNLIIARVFLQGADLINDACLRCPADTTEKEKIIELLNHCKVNLVSCSIIRDSILTQVNSNQVPATPMGSALHVRRVENLEMACDTFLLHIRRAITNICSLPRIFYPTIARDDTNFDHLAQRLATVVGSDSAVVSFLRDNAGYIRHLIDLRNGREHPRNGHPTIIENFIRLPTGKLREPAWFISNGQPASIATDMERAVNFVMQSAERLLLLLIQDNFRDDIPVRQIVEEIQKIDPDKPIKYKIAYQ